MQVCIMGAGIVGLATAYVLSREGMDVTVIDQGQPGGGASGGNGAQLSYSYVQPLADPTIWAQLPKLLLSKDSPLKIRPQLDVHQWLWGLKFLAACNAGTSGRSTLALLELARASRASFDAMLAKEQFACDFSASGKLVLLPNASAFASARAQMALQKTLGSNAQEAVDAARCIALEPALASYQSRIAGAIYTPSECAADCQKVCDGLAGVLRARGVKFVLGTRIDKLQVKGGLLASIHTAQGEITADRYVLALGAASAPMARSLGLYLPIYPLKGYSISVPVGAAATSLAPSVSVTDSTRKVVFARVGSRLRVAGMAELGGYSTQVAADKIASLRASCQAVFPGCSDYSSLNEWAGLRPATPTGVPIIGRHAKAPSNLRLNVGHGALGFTLAFGSAERLLSSLK